MEILVPKMLSAEYHITDHCAIVQLAGEEIHKPNATNVSIFLQNLPLI